MFETVNPKYSNTIETVIRKLIDWLIFSRFDSLYFAIGFASLEVVIKFTCVSVIFFAFENNYNQRTYCHW